RRHTRFSRDWSSDVCSSDLKKDGTVTPANASSISDGAAALLLMRRSEAEARGLRPLAVVRGYTQFAQEPEWFTTAPVGALKRLRSEERRGGKAGRSQGGAES